MLMVVKNVKLSQNILIIINFEKLEKKLKKICTKFKKRYVQTQYLVL